jgi:hypothetical protein
MGNNLGTQNGGGNVDLDTASSSTHIQSTIEQLLRNSDNSYAENMTFDRDTLSFERPGLSTVGGSAFGTESSLLSEFDLESIKEFRQSGGDDRLSVVPRRIRYDTSIEVPQQQPLYLNDTARRKSILLSDTSVDVEPLRGGSDVESDKASHQMDVFSATSISDNEFKILKDVILRNSTKPQAGGCGCGGDAELPLSSTSPQPVDYSILKGGANEDTDSDDESAINSDSDSDSDSNSDSDDDDDDKDDNDASSNSATDTTTASSDKKTSSDDDDDEDEDDDDENPSEKDHKLGRSKKTSKGKKTKGKKANKQKRIISTSLSGGSEMKINARYMYTSDNDAHFGSDSLSDYYKTFKNRSLL